MATVTKTVDEMIDNAIERLPFLRRKIVNHNLAHNPHRREEIADRVLLELSKDSAAEAIFGSSIAAGIESGAITAKTPIGIDVDKLAKILELIFTYLPKILDLLKLFASIVIFFAISLAMSSIATAQETKQIGNLVLNGGDCANGTCPLRARVSAVVGLQPVSSAYASPQSAPRYATSPIRPRVASVVPVVSSVVNQARPVAAIANTRQRIRSRPVRSFLGYLRPVPRRRC